MAHMDTLPAQNSAAVGISFMLVTVLAFSVNDVLIKQLSGGYPLHEMVFIRSVIGLLFSLPIVYLEGGFHLLKTRRIGMLLLQGCFLVCANLLFFMAIAMLPLAEATALFFIAPLLITLLSVPLLGERVGLFRLGAVLVGFVGVVIMLRPWEEGGVEARWVLLLPLLAAVSYALRQIMTRRLGLLIKASVLAVYIQLAFLLVSLAFFIFAGDGRYAAGTEAPMLKFLLREWIWPVGNDVYLFGLLGLCSGIAGYSVSKAYSSADAAVLAPFEYLGMPLAILFGWMFWSELPDTTGFVGIILIVAGGLLVFLREQQLSRRTSRTKRL